MRVEEFMSYHYVFMSGRGVPQTDEKAFELLQQAALEEYAMAYTPLGEMMAEGKRRAEEYHQYHGSGN